MLIAEVMHNELVEHFKLQIPVKLGNGGINDGVIIPDAFDRGVKALQLFKTHLDQFPVSSIEAFATSAIRNAQNGAEFISKVKVETGIFIHAIPGETEAEYIFEGVKHSYPMADETVMVMDIGGGSVEFILGNVHRIFWKQSFEIGASRLLQKFHHTNPISQAEIHALEAYLSDTLKPLADAFATYPAEILVGSAGSFETLRDVILQDLNGTVIPLSENACKIKHHDFAGFCRMMTQLKHEEIKALKGMTDFRTEMITVASILMRYMVDNFGFKKIIASDYSLKEGMIFGLNKKG
jgi:exopolyphosphatase/guanosine-5'-triphosphate,3'-diphosphate pyrophosphatase